MKRSLRGAVRQSLLAALMAAAVFASGAGPVSAAMPDGAYARFALMEEEGLVFLSYTGGTTVNAGVVGLIGSAEYFLRGSSQDCGHMPSAANKVFRIRAMTNGNGVLWLRRAPSIGAVVHSVWLGLTDGSEPPVCALSLNFEKYKTEVVGDWDGDAILGIWDKEKVLSLLVRKPNDRARLSIVVHGMAGDDMVTVRGVNRRCGNHPTQTFLTQQLQNVNAGAFKSRVISITPNEMGMIRSERAVFDTHREFAGIIAILIG